MKAYVLHGVNDLRYEEVNMPVVKPGWALVEVMAAGICGSDIPRIYENGTYRFPTIPGHEFSGIVRKTGSGKDFEWEGKRVGIFPLIPCKECDQCKEGNYEMCRNYDYIGSRRDGAFAEYVAVPVWNLIILPESVSFEEGAMLEPMSVALHALKQLPKGEVQSIAIFGAGPIGLIMAQWARILGIRQVIILANKEGQIELARNIGFTQNCNSNKKDAVAFIRECTNGVGTDVTVDGVGTSEILGKCIEGVRPKGSILTVGNPKGDLLIEKLIYWQILRKQLRLYGTWNSSFGTKDSDWEWTVEALLKKQMNARGLITHRLPFEELKSGLQIMRDKSEFYSKVMIAATKNNEWQK